ncbi:MAG: cytochrome C [Nitrospirae bacterium]|nr:cytochrome C [Nitrospirota bacterium]
MGRIMSTVNAAVLFTLVILAGNASAVGPGKTLVWPGGGKGEVLFEGDDHAEKGYTCEDCHPGLFSMKHGTAKITMAALDRGGFCGACHNGTTTFSTKDPKKCHECHKGGKKREKHAEHDGKKKHAHDD